MMAAKTGPSHINDRAILVWKATFGGITAYYRIVRRVDATEPGKYPNAFAFSSRVSHPYALERLDNYGNYRETVEHLSEARKDRVVAEVVENTNAEIL